MTYTLENRDNTIHVKHILTVDDKTGQQAANWWNLQIPWHKFASWFSSVDLANQALGGELIATCNHPTVAWRDARGWNYKLPDLTKTRPEIVELLPIPEKAKRASKKETGKR